MPDVAGTVMPALEAMSVDALVALKLKIEQLLAPRVHEEIETLTAKLASLKNTFGMAGDDGDAIKKKRRKRRKNMISDRETDTATASE